MKTVELVQSDGDRKYGEYTNQYLKTIQQTKTIWNLDNLNFTGTKPPHNHLTQLKSPTNPNSQYIMPQIKSLREPYHVQYMINGYGALNTRLGTQMGV